MNETPDMHVRLTPKIDRILAALWHAMATAENRHHVVTQYDLVKALFLADRAHLNAWGRPITYDNYCALVHGPVPSLAYNLLKSDAKAMRDHGIDHLPWRSSEAGANKRHYFAVPQAVDPDLVLSQSDIEALDDAIGTVRQLGFSQIRRLTHLDPAYVDAWRENGERQSYPMKLGLFFDEPDYERAAQLAEYSPYV